MTVLIIHGIGGHAGIYWQQWLHDELIKKGHRVIMPTLPNPDHPDRKECLITTKNLVKNTDLNELIIVGHSLGVVTALDFIEQTEGIVRGLAAVSGFASDYGSELNSYFMKEKEIDLKKIKLHLKKAEVFYGEGDPYVPQEVLKDLADKLGVKAVMIKNGGHLNSGNLSKEFPTLLSKILLM